MLLENYTFVHNEVRYSSPIANRVQSPREGFRQVPNSLNTCKLSICKLNAGYFIASLSYHQLSILFRAETELSI